MKRFVSIFLILFLVSALMVVPALGAELEGGYYVTGDSALGNGLTFYVPTDFAEGSLTYDGSGNLFNLTSSSVYLYCPDYPDYTIYAARFSGFQYRRNTSGYSYEDLNLRNISAGNVEIFEDDPTPLPDIEEIVLLTFSALVIGVGAFVLLRR